MLFVSVFSAHNLKHFLSSPFVFHLFEKIPRLSKSRTFSSLFSANTKSLKKVADVNSFVEKPTKYAMCTALNSCSRTLDWFRGVQIHGLMIHCGFDNNLILNSALVDFYAKCGVLEDARKVFDGMNRHDHVSWTAMISGYGHGGCIAEAILLFKEMMSANVKPNAFTYVTVMSSCAAVDARIEQFSSFHGHVIKLGFGADAFLVSSMVDYYSNRGEIDVAAAVFDSAANVDDVLYNSMIHGYCQNLCCEKALGLFIEMRNGGLRPTDYTMSIVLNICGDSTVVWLGKQVHCLVTKAGSLDNVVVSTSLIDMYSKCGYIDEARSVFDQTREKNSVLWTSMISGYAQNGMVLEGFKLSDHSMTVGNLVPDHVCFTALLTACNHAGLLDKGIEYFGKMRDYDLAPNLDQYACLIDLHARKGHLLEAKQIMEAMPFGANCVILSSFLSSCKRYGDVELGIEVAKQLLSMQPSNAAAYVTLARMYAESGSWDKVAGIRKLMDEKGRMREGWSCVELDRP